MLLFVSELSVFLFRFRVRIVPKHVSLNCSIPTSPLFRNFYVLYVVLALTYQEAFFVPLPLVRRSVTLPHIAAKLLCDGVEMGAVWILEDRYTYCDGASYFVARSDTTSE
jgi:hypothetical protein